MQRPSLRVLVLPGCATGVGYAVFLVEVVGASDNAFTYDHRALFDVDHVSRLHFVDQSPQARLLRSASCDQADLGSPAG